MFLFSFLNTMTLIAYYQGNLIADRLHNNADIPWAHVKTKEKKVLISSCGRAAMAITGFAYNEHYRLQLLDAMVEGIAVWEGDLAKYLNYLYTETEEATKIRQDMFEDYGNFSMIIATSTGAFSISRHTDDPEIREVMPRRYDFDSTAAFGTGATAFLMLAGLDVPIRLMTKIIASNDSLISQEYDCVPYMALKPFKKIIRVKKGD